MRPSYYMIATVLALFAAWLLIDGAERTRPELQATLSLQPFPPSEGESPPVAVPDIDYQGSLTAPAAPRVPYEPPMPMSVSTLVPLADRFEADLLKATEGDSGLAARLARDLIFCGQHLDHIDKLGAKAAVAYATGRSDEEVHGLERSVASARDEGPTAAFCAGITRAEVEQVPALLEGAVESGSFAAVGDYLGVSYRSDVLRKYLRDPAAYEAFKRRSVRALRNGLEQCDRQSISLMGQLYASGDILPHDPTRAFAYELAAVWVEERDPDRAVVLDHMRSDFSAQQLNGAIGFARQLFGRYCQ